MMGRACRLGAVLAGMAALLAPGVAQARVWWGVGIGVPVWPAPYVYRPPGWVAPAYPYPPPYYYPPPVIYAPPPVIYAPPGWVAPGSAPAPAAGPQICDAGPYRCPMERPTAPGNACWCTGNQGQRVTGVVR